MRLFNGVDISLLLINIRFDSADLEEIDETSPRQYVRFLPNVTLDGQNWNSVHTQFHRNTYEDLSTKN